MESELSSSLAQTSQSLGASNDVAVVQAKLAAQAQIQKQSLERIRGLRPEGRISLSIQADTNNAQIQLPLLTLQNADKLFVPSRPDFVFLFGAVNTESALLYQPGLTVASYIERAGQNSSADKDSIILIRADGSALTSSSWWKNEVLSTKVMPGDTIVLPEKQDRESAWSTVFRNTKDVTQILYNLGLGAAAIKTLRQ